MGISRDPLFYPLAGLTYVLSHPSLWGSVICVALIGIFVAVATLILLLTTALLPQALLFGGQWWSWVLAIFAVFFEALVMAAILLRFVQSKCQKTLFVKTMKEENKWTPSMVEPSLMNDLNCCKMKFLVRVVTFPLNIIPMVGTVVYAYVNAPFVAWDNMDMYMDAIHMDSKSQRIEVLGADDFCPNFSTYKLSNAYLRFGFSCTLLEIVPVLGPAVFSLTNACGAALWASEMETNGGPKTMSSQLKLASL